MSASIDRAVARELLAVARELVAMEFPTQDALDKYLKEHPDADRSLHKVKKTPSKPLSRGEKEQVENALRDHLSGTGKAVTKEQMQSRFRTPAGKKMTDEQFSEVWDGLVEDGYLEKTEGGYKWEM